MAKELNPNEALEELNKGFHEFKAENDKGRKADREMLARLEEKMNRADEVLAKHAAQAEEMKAVRAQLESLEKVVARGGAPAAGGAKVETNEHKSAFEKYLRRGKGECREELEKKTLTLADDTTGGFLATTDYVREIIKAEVLSSPMRTLVRVRPTSKTAIKVPKRTQTAKAVWVGEIETRGETQNPAYGSLEIPTHEMSAVAYISFADLEDSEFDLAAELSAEFAEQFGVTEGQALIGASGTLGDGRNKPLGFLSDAGVLANFNVSGTAATIADANGVADGLVDVCHNLKTAYAARARWLLNRITLGSVRKLKDAQKRYIWQPAPSAGMPSTILDLPYTEAPDMPNEGAGAFPIALGDWQRAYTLADRIAMSVTRDEFTKADQGLVKFSARKRIGGQVVLAEAIRLLKCST